jgi:ribosomal protein L37AE/L43A
MKTFRFSLYVVTWVGLTNIAMSGCERPEHRTAHKRPGTKIVCQKCYDEVSTVRRQAPRSDTTFNVIVATHQCPECKSDMSIYREKGILKVKCQSCAPAGLDCDLCLPPDAPVQ